MKRLLFYLFPFYISGILYYNSKNIFYLCAVLSALFLILLYKKNHIVYFGILLFIFGYTASYIHNQNFNDKFEMIKRLDTLEGYVIEKNDNNYTIKNYKDDYVVLLKVIDKNNIKVCDYIIFTGQIRERYPYKDIAMKAYNVNAYISSYSFEITKTNKKSLILLPIKLKYTIIDKLISIDNKAGAFISGIVFGYDKLISKEEKENFNNLGISHILAVSGFNIGIIYYFIKHILKNLSAKVRDFVCISVCFIYTFLSGFEPSILRAFLLIVLITAAKIMKRTKDIITFITLAGFIMLTFNSYYIYNAGFLLSFAATYSITILGSKLKDKFKDIRILKDEIIAASSSFIGTFPIVLWYNGYISLITILINVLISPLIAFLTIFSFISVLFYAVIRIDYLLYPILYLGRLFVDLISNINKINIILILGSPNILFIISYYILVLIFLDFIKLNIKRYLIISIATFFMIFSMLYKQPYLKIHFLNVGQGDSIFIETPERYSILIDTGPSYKEYSAARDIVLPYIKRCGYNKIDMLILTHMHSDHAGGLEYIVNNFTVKSIAAFNDKDIKYNTIKVLKGDKIKVNNLNIDIIYPPEDYNKINYGNEGCLVFNLTYKNFSMLLTADAQKNVMDNIKGYFDVVKIPHHGSIESFSEKFINNSIIKTAIISVGKNNFNHPSDFVISKLKEKDIKVLRTDELGTITIITDGQKYKIYYK